MARSFAQLLKNHNRYDVIACQDFALFHSGINVVFRFKIGEFGPNFGQGIGRILNDGFSDVRVSCYLSATNKNKGSIMRVLGIDPGLRSSGWGIVDVMGSRIKHVANGQCQTTAGPLPGRLLQLFEQLSMIVDRHTPTEAAVEHTFVNKDAVGTLKLGQARGIALLVPARFGLVVGEYAPNAVKKAVVGVGHADKAQIAHMVKLQLPGVELAGPDAADALAIAMCHAHHLQSTGKFAAALEKASA